MPIKAVDAASIHLQLEAVLDDHRRRGIPEATIAAAIERLARSSAAQQRVALDWSEARRFP